MPRTVLCAGALYISLMYKGSKKNSITYEGLKHQHSTVMNDVVQRPSLK